MCPYGPYARFRASAAILLAIPLLAAGSQGTQMAAGQNATVSSTARETSAGKIHLILMSGFQFQPDTLAVRTGDSVQWKNEDIVPHTVTAVNKEFHSGSIPPGGSWNFIARRKGTYDYFCSLHPNMKATLIVQ